MSDTSDLRYPHRIAGLRGLFPAAEGREAVDSVVVTHRENIRYLTGFTGSSGLIVVTEREAVFLTDGRYALQSATEVPGFERVILPPGSNLAAAAGDVLQRLGVRRAGFEAQHLPYASFEALRRAMPAGVVLVPRLDAVETLRRIKDDEELALMRRALAIADECFDYIRTHAKAGMTERELAWGMESFMRHERGANKLAFDCIVASGPNSALIHGRASDRVLGSSGSPELLLTDFGCELGGYNSDLTRTTVLGGEPTARQQELYDAVAHAQRLALESIRPGVAGKDVDTLARDALTAAGLGDAFAHSLGHGLGISVHDHPALGQKSDLVLAPGMVVTVEPGAYLEGFGGVRIEDVVLVTEDGCENLTKAPKGLFVVG